MKSGQEWSVWIQDPPEALALMLSLPPEPPPLSTLTPVHLRRPQGTTLALQRSECLFYHRHGLCYSAFSSYCCFLLPLPFCGHSALLCGFVALTCGRLLPCTQGLCSYLSLHSPPLCPPGYGCALCLMILIPLAGVKAGF